MEKRLSNYSLDEIESAKGKIKMLETRRKEFKILKNKLEERLDFEVTNYIIDDILDYETYHHTCLMINLAVVNNRLSIENGDRLKVELKTMFNITSDYDTFDRKVYIANTFDFDAWYEKYSTVEMVDLKELLTKTEIELIKKLKIEVKNKIYTEQEFEFLNMDLLDYYRNEKEMDEEELKESKDLPEGVSREDYNNLLDKINEIAINKNF